MYQQTKNSCTKASDNWSGSKDLKPKKSRGGVNSRLLGLNKRTVAMTKVIEQHVRHLGSHIGFFDCYIFSKIKATFF